MLLGAWYFKKERRLGLCKPPINMAKVLFGSLMPAWDSRPLSRVTYSITGSDAVCLHVRVRDSGSGQGHRRRSSGSMACMAMLVDGKKHGGAWEAARQLG